MSGTQKIKCRNREQTERSRGNGTWFDDCRGCPLVYTHLSNNGPSGDIVRCESPIPIKFGDVIEVIPKTARRVEERKSKPLPATGEAAVELIQEYGG